MVILLTQAISFCSKGPRVNRPRPKLRRFQGVVVLVAEAIGPCSKDPRVDSPRPKLRRFQGVVILLFAEAIGPKDRLVEEELPELRHRDVHGQRTLVRRQAWKQQRRKEDANSGIREEF